MAPLDPKQLARIRAEHTGFLYQHLYAVACLLGARDSGTEVVRVERDEDVELVGRGSTSYVQVKFRSALLQPSDLGGVIERFDALRAEHASGRRAGAASFWIATSQEGSASLVAQMATWPADVRIIHAQSGGLGESCPPLPPQTLDELWSLCVALAARVPLSSLRPETLVWKLAGMIQDACAGRRPSGAFAVGELPSLFEQIIAQLQAFPAPPEVYRPHADEPPFATEQPVRLIVGPPGSGKSAWAAVAGQSLGHDAAYVDFAQSSAHEPIGAVAREIAARWFAGDQEVLIALAAPSLGAAETLRMLAARLREKGATISVFLDNAQRVDADLLARVCGSVDTSALRFVVLAQPWPGLTELQARLQIEAEDLAGWAAETVASAAAARGCLTDGETAERVRRLTGGLPLFVADVIHLAVSRAIPLASVCAEFDAQAHTRATVQDAILGRVIASLDRETQGAAAALSDAEIELTIEHSRFLIEATLGTTPARAAFLIRELSSWGIAREVGGERLAVHDAFHAPLLALNRRASPEALKFVLLGDMRRSKRPKALRRFLRLLHEVGETRALVDTVSTMTEQIEDFGIARPVTDLLEVVRGDPRATPYERVWALDSLAFFRSGEARADALRDLAREIAAAGEELTGDERAHLLTKRIIERGEAGDVLGAERAAAECFPLAQNESQGRVLRYSLAVALDLAGEHARAETMASALVSDYLSVLGLEEDDLRSEAHAILHAVHLVREFASEARHLADCLVLAASSRVHQGSSPGLNRISALKLFIVANAPSSIAHTALDAANDCLRFGNDPARAVHLLTLVERVLEEHEVHDVVVPAAALRAVALAHLGQIPEAHRELARVEALALGSQPDVRGEYERQRALVLRIAQEARPQGRTR